MIIGASRFKAKKGGGEIAIPEHIHHQIRLRNGRRIKVIV